MVLYSSDTMTLSVKLYANGLVTATVEYYTDAVNTHKIVNDVSICRCGVMGDSEPGSALCILLDEYWFEC